MYALIPNEDGTEAIHASWSFVRRNRRGEKATASYDLAIKEAQKLRAFLHRKHELLESGILVQDNMVLFTATIRRGD